MNILFGTDGIRGLVNTKPIDPVSILKIGQGIANYSSSKDNNFKILIGYDTRVSSHMILGSLISGICSMGGDVFIAGIIPTPAISFLTAKDDFSLGIVITASHNKFFDNGIKFFDKTGNKLDKDKESKLLEHINKVVLNKEKNIKSKIGRTFIKLDAISKYTKFLKSSCYENSEYCFQNIKVSLDCANGSTSVFVSKFLKDIGAKVNSIFSNPNGENINKNCGSEDPSLLSKKVIEDSADIGLAFDGDGDRLVVVSSTGQVLKGEQIIALLAYEFKKKGLLKNDIIISTIMSNSSLDSYLYDIGIKHVKTNIGDKFVSEKMKKLNSNLGGENSGHMIFSDYLNTGDGILSALFILHILKNNKKSISNIINKMENIPQLIKSLNITSKPDLFKSKNVQNTISYVKKKLGKTGKVLVRYSGTEPKCRIMLEGKNLDILEKYFYQISKAIVNFIEDNINKVKN